jgi:hypothetical protein
LSLAVFTGLFLLLGVHVARPKSRALSYALPLTALVIVRLAHG